MSESASRSIVRSLEIEQHVGSRFSRSDVPPDSTTVLGHSIRRSEDPTILTGGAAYVDDVALRVGACAAVFVRAEEAHAVVRGIDGARSRAMPGVVAVFTDADLGLPPARAMVGDGQLDRPRLARDRIRFVGDAVAVVVAETRAQAVDAAEAVVIDTDPLPAVANADDAIADGAPLLFPKFGSNATTGAVPAAGGEAWPDADVVVRARIRHPRVAPAPMEPNGCVVAPDGDRLEIWASTQSVFGVRGEIANALNLDEANVVVRAPAVGGGFGAKGGVYNEQVVVAAIARRLARPVAWVETRRENLLNMTHGRDQVHDLEVGARRNGEIVGLRVRSLANVGAYPIRGVFIPWVTQIMASGVYRIPAIEFHGVPVVTNTTPTGPYRGAGRPEAAAMTERAIELVALELGIDAIDVRRRNFIPKDDFPYRTATGATYDSGDYDHAMSEALRFSDYERWREQQAARRHNGRTQQLGVGVACYVEVSGRGNEYGSVRVEPDGSATVVTGSVPNGQGHETAWAQIVSSTLGIPFARISVVHSDTELVARGVGTFGSRSAQLAGSAAKQAAEAVLVQAREVVARMLEAALNDIVVFDDGRLGVNGVPATAVSWDRVAGAAEQPLYSEIDFQSDGSFPFGCHVAIVEIDTETGAVRVLRLVAVDDCGTVLNPMLAAGQAHGGIAQGLAHTLFEEVAYDDDANPLTATFMDYAMPSAAELLSFDVHHTVTPSPRNPLGVKGIGESGTTGATAAVWNAVVDALRPYGVTHLDPPFTPQRVWQAITSGGHS
jgi:carbon-monoxide dehydrogenase large subunit